MRRSGSGVANKYRKEEEATLPFCPPGGIRNLAIHSSEGDLAPLEAV